MKAGPPSIEGNPDHPQSLGATDIFLQASILDLYDPDRSQTVLHLGEPRSHDEAVAVLRTAMAAQQARQGAGLHILTRTVVSPTLGQQLKDLLADLPRARWHQYQPVGRDTVRSGSLLAFGEYVNTTYRFDRARVILSLDSDFLMTDPARLRYTRDFTRGRQLLGGRTEMNRLYVAECTPTHTGARADHRLPLRPSEIEACTRALALRLGVPAAPAALPGPAAGFVSAVHQDLLRHRGESLIVPGACQPPEVHALAHAMNHALGNVGSTAIYTDPVEAAPVDQAASLRDLCADLRSGAVEVLLILGGNPAYDAPADLSFGSLLLHAGTSVHLSPYADETAALCHWHVLEAHPLESFGDTRSADGTITIQQPLIAPLYGGKSACEVLAVLLDQPVQSAYEIIRSHWREAHEGADFEDFFRRALHDGLMAGPRELPAPTGTEGILQHHPEDSGARE